MFRQQPRSSSNQQGSHHHNFVAQLQTMPQPVVTPPQPFFNNMPNTPLPPSIATLPTPAVAPAKKTRTRIIAVLLVLGLAGAIFFLWHSTPVSTPAVTANVNQQNFSATVPVAPSTFSTAGSTTSSTDGIKVYVVGAVKNPGVYTLTVGARVYDLLQAAGGTLPKANLVAINMAAKLSDGQEVYVTLIGEAPPTYIGGVPGPGTGNTSGGNTNGQLVNVNTASVDELSLGLHISKKSAQAIVDYRTQHGTYSSVDQLAAAVSTSIYNKIKALCTV